MRQSAVLFIVLVLICLSDNVIFADYTLIVGKGNEVCEDYLANLQLSGKEPMICERYYFCEYKDKFSKPIWERQDMANNRNLMKKLYKFISFGSQYAIIDGIDDEKILYTPFFNIEHGIDEVIFSKVDIDNDGKLEDVVLYRKGKGCISHYFAVSLLVLTDNNTTIDVAKTKMLLRNADGYDLNANAIEHIFKVYDVFFYKKRTYYDKWDAYESTLSVYDILHSRSTERCKYKYTYHDKVMQ